MVIQRWQTVMLLVAAIIMAVFCFCPFATKVDPASAESVSPVFVKDAPVLLVLNIVIAALLFITIFQFKNLRQQMRLTILCLVLICASMVTSGFIIGVALPGGEPVLLGGVLLLILAAIFALFAYRFMRSDYKLLNSYNRLR